MRRLEYTRAAETDFINITRYIAGQSGDARIAFEFSQKLRERCEKLAALPGTLGTARPDVRSDLRSVPYKAYVIFFRYADDALEIVNVLNGSRDVIAYFQGDSPPTTDS